MITAYISGPLTNGGKATASERHANLCEAVAAFRECLALGISAYVPHLTLILESEHGVVLPHNQWIALDLPWVAKADILWRLPGDSSGADAEVAHARKHDVPVVYSLDELQRLLKYPEPFPLPEYPNRPKVSTR